MRSLALSICLFFTSLAYAWQPLVYQATNGKVYYKGKPYHQGLPDTIRIKDIQLAGNTFYFTSHEHGLFKRTVGDSSWYNITPYDAHMRTINGLLSTYRSISAFCVDGSVPTILYVATKYSLYRSNDGGTSWHSVALTGLPANACITALYANGSTLMVGTSWNGVYRYTGSRFINYSNGLPRKHYSDSIVFIEGVYRVTPQFCITAYTNEVFAYNGKEWERQFRGHTNKLWGGSIGGSVVVMDNDAVVTLTGQKKQYYELSPMQAHCALFTNGTYVIFAQAIEQKNDTIRGLYAGVPSSWKDVKELVVVAKKAGYNALVFDIKDDYGNVYVSESTAASIGALRKGLPPKELCTYVHKHTMQAIARMVVFKDERLFKAFDTKYAIKDGATKTAWRGNPKEYWVDPYSEFVHGYNIAIAQEAQKAGFDEIQFDYIRFPTDGPVHRCVFTFKPTNGIYKYEAIAHFLRCARQALQVPISVDVYGFTVWYEFGQWLGQDIEAMASIADVLCPMVYPSHYGRKFFDGSIDSGDYYAIVTESNRRALIQSQAIVRPYLQAFKMLSPNWGYDYIQKQIKGCSDMGVHGYILWNAARDYGVIVNRHN
ncbi:MAG: putative glycoside hydrolase [Spirochaetota bacterium]